MMRIRVRLAVTTSNDSMPIASMPADCAAEISCGPS
jgi:hypothetical protein